MFEFEGAVKRLGPVFSFATEAKGAWRRKQRDLGCMELSSWWSPAELSLSRLQYIAWL
ncbi:MAG: hypothetical protein WCF20_06070 [Methylovirgula sp.]